MLIRLGIIRIRLDCVFQHVNSLWKIVVLYQQARYARGELRLARIDVEYLTIRLQRAIHLAVFFENHSFNKMRERASLAFASGTQSEV